MRRKQLKTALLFTTSVLAVAGLLIWRNSKPLPQDAAIAFRESLQSHDWREIYRMAPSVENEAVGWTEQGFAKAMDSALEGVDLRSAKMHFLEQRGADKSFFGCYIDFPKHATSKEKTVIGLDVRRGRDRWYVSIYSLPSQACRLINKDERSQAGCLARSMKAAGLSRVLDPYAHVQRTVEALEQVASGQLAESQSITRQQ